MADVSAFLLDPSIRAGIFNPDTNEFDFKGSFDELMENRFGDSKSDIDAMIADIKERIELTKGETKDKSNAIIGDHESQTITKNIDPAAKVIEPGGLSGEVAKEKGRKEINDVKMDGDRSVSALKAELERLKALKATNPSDHMAKRLGQGYVLFNRTNDGWEIIASTIDPLMNDSIVGILGKVSEKVPVVVSVGGKKSAVPAGLAGDGVKNFLSQQASLRSKSVTAGFWGKRFRHL